MVYPIVTRIGEFQGPALVAIFEGSSLSTEEISGLQFRPPWKLRGDTLNYGLGLLSCYYVCDLLYIISGGYFYIFDPRGIALSVAPKSAPGAKMFSLIGMSFIQPRMNIFMLSSYKYFISTIYYLVLNNIFGSFTA